MCFFFSYGMITLTLDDMALIGVYKDLLDILEFDVLITNRLYQFVVFSGVIFQDNFGLIMIFILHFFILVRRNYN